MRSKGDNGLKDRTMELDHGFGRWVRGVAEVVDVALGAQAADDDGAGWCVHGWAMTSRVTSLFANGALRACNARTMLGGERIGRRQAVEGGGRKRSTLQRRASHRPKAANGRLGACVCLGVWRLARMRGQEWGSGSRATASPSVSFKPRGTGTTPFFTGQMVGRRARARKNRDGRGVAAD